MSSKAIVPRSISAKILLGSLFFKKSTASGLQRALKEKELEGIQIGKLEGMQLGRQEGIQLGEQRGIKLGRQEGISSILELARQGHIDQSIADKILKEKFGI